MFQILIVEDDKNTLRLMKAVLTRSGYKTFQAENGLDAFEIIDKQHIDLIVLDVMMPVMDGYEFTEHLRSVKNNTPILMVTAKQLPEENARGLLLN